jgi:hypothetical protein
VFACRWLTHYRDMQTEYVIQYLFLLTDNKDIVQHDRAIKYILCPEHK